jgi:aminoglycoside phosphotransferase (APT) family kinase protein
MTFDIQLYFKERGFPLAEPLGDGMEGAVYDLGDGRIGKLWFRRRTDELEVLQEFYSELAGNHSPIAFPEIFEVCQAGDRAVTIERKLSGSTLRDRLDDGMFSAEAGRACVLEVLAALREVQVGAGARRLAVVDEDRALWAAGDSWPQALAALVERKVARFGGQLRAAVTDFDAKLERIRWQLDRLPETAIRAVHGDLVPENILVDDACRPLAVLDWGFLSTAGDPAFEAGLAAALFDMYGVGARQSEDALLTSLHESAGYDLQRMKLYRAVYAIVTSNAYDPEGRDGHFAWCAASLEREDVVAALWADASAL